MICVRSGTAVSDALTGGSRITAQVSNYFAGFLLRICKYLMIKVGSTGMAIATMSGQRPGAPVNSPCHP